MCLYGYVMQLMFEDSTWRFSVCADSESNIAGYQFGVDIEDFTVTSVSNGSASANVLSENGQTFL